MKMNKHNRLFTTAAMLGVAAFSVLAAVSCQKDDDNLVDLTAVIADKPASGAKVTIDNERYACWSAGDVVSINGNEYTVAIRNDGSTHVTISGVTYNSDGYAAVYPASCHKTENAGSTSATIILPDAQEWDEDHIVTPMVAYTTSGGSGSTLLFHNPCNLLKVTVQNNLEDDLLIHQIVATSTNTILTGEASVTGLDGTPTISIVTGGTKDVTLKCGDQRVSPGEANAYTFYVTVPKVSGEQFRFRVLAKTDGGTKYTFDQTSQAGINLYQNEMVPISITLGSGNANGNNNFWGQGTEACPYLITDKTDLSHFIGQTSGCFKQTADIDYGESDFINTATFSGHYDGGGHYIEFNLSTTGLVTKLGSGAVIENLTLKGNPVENTEAKWGAFCCELASSGTVTLKNCTNEIQYTYTKITSASGLGGLIGYASNTSLELTLENCSNKVDISGKGYVGGVLGYAKVSSIAMTGCSNEGAVTCASASSAASVGGFVSYVELNNSATCTMDRCRNSGAVKMDDGGSDVTSGACGGIIGFLNEKSTSTATITNCANKADVSAARTINYMGGIVGRLQSNSANVKCYVYNCYSTGDLDRSSTTVTVTDMGGIMAIYNYPPSYKIYINNCYFSGSLSEGGKTNYSGIASKTGANIDCDNCYSVNNCTGVGKAAGISITSITIADTATLRSNLNTIARSSGWSDWKGKTGTYPVFSWEE